MGAVLSQTQDGKERVIVYFSKVVSQDYRVQKKKTTVTTVQIKRNGKKQSWY